MLQEIINRLDGFLGYTQKKITSIFFDVTIGLFKGYRDKLLELARITATTYYLQAVRVLRYFSIVIFCVIAGAVVFALALVATPITLVLLAPWSNQVKMIVIGVLGFSFVGGVLWLLAALFSEKRWMEFTRAKELLEQAIKENKL